MDFPCCLCKLINRKCLSIKSNFNELECVVGLAYESLIINSAYCYRFLAFIVVNRSLR